jgi:hypothetical protein
MDIPPYMLGCCIMPIDMGLYIPPPIAGRWYVETVMDWAFGAGLALCAIERFACWNLAKSSGEKDGENEGEADWARR